MNPAITYLNNQYNVLGIKSVCILWWENSEVLTDLYPVTENDSVGTCTTPLYPVTENDSVGICTTPLYPVTENDSVGTCTLDDE